MKTREYRTRTKVITIVLSGLVVLYTVTTIISTVLSFSIPRLSLKSPLPSTNLTYMEVNFPSRYDGINLAGWFLITRGERVIVVVNGGFQNRTDDNVDTAGLTQDLTARGYDIFLFDQRGRGESEGKGRALSNFESDIGGAIDYLKDGGYDIRNITLLGFCSGAFSTLLFATHEDVGALIIDGCFATVEGMVVRQAAERNIPGFLVECFIPGMKVAARAMYGFRIVEPINEVEKVRCPVFFIHEEKDDLVTWEETQQLYRASKNPANEIWHVPGALHSQAYRNYPDEFVDRIDRFLKKSQEMKNRRN
jgi:pimeloyl-ACP methyl ester carboxylesterase